MRSGPFRSGKSQKAKLMLIRRISGIVFAAYLGGLIGSYLAMLVMSPQDVLSRDLRLVPFRFAVGLLFWTVPGALFVATFFRLARSQCSPNRRYAAAILVGTVSGGVVLGTAGGTLAAGLLGASYALVTSGTWALINRYLLPAF